MDFERWGSYLCRGSQFRPPFVLERILADSTQRDHLAEVLERRGWATIDASDADFKSVGDWEHAFSHLFSLSRDVKIKGGEYRSVDGLAVGYKTDDKRQFLECHLTSEDVPEPSYSFMIDHYDNMVKNLFSCLSHITRVVLTAVAARIGVSPESLIGLTDSGTDGLLPSSNRPKLSSSVLRICLYPFSASEVRWDNSIQFGAHTDTSMVTVALHSTQPGLEIYDRVARSWVCPENLYAHIRSGGRTLVNVFVGEFLEVLTKHKIPACIHRVRTTPFLPRGSSCVGRISCPLIVRGLDGVTIRFNDEAHQHPSDELSRLRRSFYLADLDGIPMRVLHKLLDAKRRKCFERNQEADGWVLSAFEASAPNEPVY